jgi:hypothetical protein
MLGFGQPQPNQQEEKWRRQLAEFVKSNQKELAALSWGLHLENPESQDHLGIDLKPNPHFVSCPKEAIETLNQNVDNHLREVIGIVENHNREKEVLIIGIGPDQIKIVQFEIDPAPPICFEEIGKDIDTLVTELEEKMNQQIVNR